MNLIIVSKLIVILITLFLFTVLWIVYLCLCFQVGDDLLKKTSALSTNDHLPLTEYMFDAAIKVLSAAAFGAHFKDEKKVNQLWKAYNTVRIHYYFIIL